jgi:hypothetical protein
MNSHIVLYNRGVLPTYLVVHYRAGARDWDITEIEMYADEQLGTLICDAITFDQLPPKSRAGLLRAMNESRHQAAMAQTAMAG